MMQRRQQACVTWHLAGGVCQTAAVNVVVVSVVVQDLIGGYENVRTRCLRRRWSTRQSVMKQQHDRCSTGRRVCGGDGYTAQSGSVDVGRHLEKPPWQWTVMVHMVNVAACWDLVPMGVWSGLDEDKRRTRRAWKLPSQVYEDRNVLSFLYRHYSSLARRPPAVTRHGLGWWVFGQTGRKSEKGTPEGRHRSVKRFIVHNNKEDSCPHAKEEPSQLYRQGGRRPLWRLRYRGRGPGISLERREKKERRCGARTEERASPKRSPGRALDECPTTLRACLRTPPRSQTKLIGGWRPGLHTDGREAAIVGKSLSQTLAGHCTHALAYCNSLYPPTTSDDERKGMC
ncbi:hypothetical protein B0J11DRAFT_509677 [Dendryphion nanum]|uniref:Uncharacterized protein n=1 Tax=Dendryphion nanum TaxID=256645 RepID=A0A9P9DEM2_9PLEO|nr:hypothetical protein B0J11DRAFT_509677 [Dendryphion nanum]